MESMQPLSMTSDLTQLSNEMTYQKYLMNRASMKELFEELSVPGYVTLCLAKRMDQGQPKQEQKIYLREIADQLQLSISQTSKMIGKLRDKGLLIWTHDGKGRKGTYITITDLGREKLKKQEEILKDFYETVIEQFGKEDFIQLIQMMHRLEAIMQEELGQNRVR